MKSENARGFPSRSLRGPAKSYPNVHLLKTPAAWRKETGAAVRDYYCNTITREQLTTRCIH